MPPVLLHRAVKLSPSEPQSARRRAFVVLRVWLRHFDEVLAFEEREPTDDGSPPGDALFERVEVGTSESVDPA